MANKWQIQEDLQTRYGAANFVHTNVTGLTDDPTVYTLDDGYGAPTSSNGLIQIGEARFIRFEHINTEFRDEIWVCDVDIFYDGNLTTLREIVGEMDRLHNTNNVSTSRTYFIEFIRIDDDDAKAYGRIRTSVKITYIFASVPT